MIINSIDCLDFNHFFVLFQQQNSEYFSQYLTEDIHEYIARKRYLGVQGNHLEIQALSEMYNRPIHIYSYSAEPMNSFQVSTGGLIPEEISICSQSL